MRLAVAALLAMAATPAVGPVMLTAPERAAARTINADLLRGHIRFLSSDLLGGRGPATTGDRLAQQYIAAQMEAAGLQPGAPGGGWLQPLDIVGVTSHNPDVATVTRGGEKADLKYKDDYIAFSGVGRRRRGWRTRRSCSSATESSPPSTSGTTTRAWTSRARSCS
jgi:hypothetical protein